MLKKIFRITGITLVVLVGIIALIVTCIVAFLPRVPVDEKLIVAVTPDRVARGKYLALHVAACIDCHSKRDGTRYAKPLQENTEGQGGAVFRITEGNIVSPNITPAALKNWTDGELFRAITGGVNKDGRALFPLMPYQNFGKMDKEDIYDIIAYVRTLPSLPSVAEKTSLHFPMNIIVHTIPGAGTPVLRPHLSDTLAYGAYVVNAAGCANCHSPKVKGKDIPGREFAGGFVLHTDNGRTVTTANITPDMETGIGEWTSDMFLERFRICLDSTYAHPVSKRDHQTEMPWTFYAGMEEQDIRAMYAWLHTVKPVKNKIFPFAAPTTRP